MPEWVVRSLKASAATKTNSSAPFLSTLSSSRHVAVGLAHGHLTLVPSVSG